MTLICSNVLEHKHNMCTNATENHLISSLLVNFNSVVAHASIGLATYLTYVSICMIINLISAWMSNNIPSKLWYEIIYPFLNLNGGAVWEWKLFHTTLHNECSYLSLLGFKLIHVRKGAQGICVVEMHRVAKYFCAWSFQSFRWLVSILKIASIQCFVLLTLNKRSTFVNAFTPWCRDFMLKSHEVVVALFNWLCYITDVGQLRSLSFLGIDIISDRTSLN